MKRRERIEKIVNVLSMIFPEAYIMDKKPEELENLFYGLITMNTPITKKYLEEVYDKKGNRPSNKKLSKEGAIQRD